MKETISIEAIHPLYVGELGHAMSQINNIRELYKATSEDTTKVEPPKPYTVVDGIAVYKVFGPLITNGDWWSRYLGYTAYDDFREGVVEAVNDPDVKEVLLFIGSPGGSVFGIADASEALSKVAKVKPLYVYSQKTVASAAYWLASNAVELIASPESEWGSVGVVVTHFSYEGMMEKEGVKATIIKSGELKGVGGPYKDLTEKEITYIQTQVDQYNDLFQEQIRVRRPSVRLSAMKGETYIGSEALRMGLIDAVMSYDQTIDYIKGKRAKLIQTGGYNMKMAAEELKTALDAGATLDSLGLSEEEIVKLQDSLGSEGDVKATVAEEESKVEVTQDTIDINALQEQILALTQQIAEQTKELEELRAASIQHKVESEMIAEMKTIISAIINNRRIGLGLSKIDFSAFSVESLLVDYRAVSEQFDKMIKVGSLFSHKNEEKKPAVVQDRTHAAALDAASI